MCRFPGCANEPTRWSRTGFCRDHRGTALVWCAVRRHHAHLGERQQTEIELSEKLKVFAAMDAALRKRFPQLAMPFIRSAYGYEVIVAVPGGLRA